MMPFALATCPRTVQTQILNFLMTVIYWIPLSVSPVDTIPTTTDSAGLKKVQES